MKKEQKLFTVHDIVMVGVLASVCFITTMFLSFKIFVPPVGQTMIKTANIFCLLSGMILGGVKGGLAAGIGSFLYDLTDPLFISDAPFTFVFFFIMAYLCGIFYNLAENSLSKKRYLVWSIVGATAGQTVYILLLFTKRILTLMLTGSTFEAAWIGNLPRLATSLINMAIAVPCAVILAPIVIQALKKAKIYQKLTKRINQTV